MTPTFKIILVIVCILSLGGVVLTYFTNKNLQHALQHLDNATQHLDSATVRITSADSTVMNLKDKLTNYSKFLDESRKEVDRINADYEQKVRKFGNQTNILISDIEKIKVALNKINPPNNKVKINVTDK